MSQKIYFAGSIRGGRQDVHIYHDIITELKNYGTVFTEFVGDQKITETNLDAYPGKKEDKFIHDDNIGLFKECDCIVAEVTQPSLGVGYEIGRAVAMKKPVLCLYRPQEGKLLSGMIRGAQHGTDFIVIDYMGVSEIPDILKTYFENK